MAITQYNLYNDKQFCCIRIEASWNTNNIDSYSLFRKEGNVWNEINHGETSGNSVTLYDVETISGITYTYRIKIMSGSTTIDTSTTKSCECRFRGISLSDATGTWCSDFGSSDNELMKSMKKNNQVGYINTLTGKYPHRVINSDSNYYTGEINALFIPLNASGCPSFDDINAYRYELMEFLCNKYKKILKTGEGRAFIVSIDGAPEEVYNLRDDVTTVRFTWTQIGTIYEPKYTRSSPVWDGGNE